MRNTRAALALLLWTGALAAGAQPQTHCPVMAGASARLGEQPAAARMAYLQHRLERERGPARAWTLGWGLGYGVLTLGQLAALPTQPPADQVDLVVGALATAAALGPMAALPLETLDVPPASSFEQGGCSALALLESRLTHAAQVEADGRGWVSQGINIGVNVITGLVLGLGFSRWVSGAVTTLVGILLSEAQIFTQPVQLVEDAARYREGRLEEQGASATQLSVGSSMRGLSVSVTF